MRDPNERHQREAYERARTVFGAAVIDRRSVPRGRLGGQLPDFLSEYLIALHGLTEAGLVVQNHFPTERNRHRLRYELLVEGKVELLDYLDVAIDLQNQRAVGKLTAFQFSCPILPSILNAHPDLLAGGLWGRIRLACQRSLASPELLAEQPVDPAYLAWDPEDDLTDDEPGNAGITVVDFEPYQVGVALGDFVKARRAFSAEAWIDLLLASAGYNVEWIRAQPDGQRLTRLYLARLLPLVERNLNLIELGPKNTGKTHLLRNLSPSVFTLAGGQATPANLFVNLATGAAGLIQSRRVIVFDEVARLRFSKHAGTVALLKDYMESGQFTRGREAYGADTSLVFMGNLEVEGARPSPRYRHLFQMLPKDLQETALLDRLHGLIPGWEFPKLTPAALTPAFSLASDYFGEALLALRDLPYDDVWTRVLLRWPEFGHPTRRDVTAVDRIGRGLFKLVFPDGQVDDSVADGLLSIAAELRQRIHDQLVKIEPGEFPHYPVGFDGVAVSHDGPEHVETPMDERMNHAPRPGEATGVALLEDTEAGTVGADVVMVQVVVSDVAQRAAVFADPGILGSEVVWETARFFVGAHVERLGLMGTAQWDGLGVKFIGGPGEVR
ncbi:MAG: hypothetical protein M0Z36_11320, partial [Thermaerobacter sp.]|nr:hypothetical protein [Thermaerobacter sp.]